MATPNRKGGYRSKAAWQWIVIYLALAALVYLFVYYMAFGRR